MCSSGSRICRFLAAALLFALFGTVGAGTSEARNVPGSAAAALPHLIVTSNQLIITDILGEVRELAGGRAGAGIKLNAAGPVPVASRTDSFGVSLQSASVRLLSEGGFGAYTVGHYRRIDADGELDADLFTGGLMLAYQLSPELMISGGVVGEQSDGETPFNAGTIDSSGIGVALAANYAMTNEFSVSVLGGYLALDYDVTRSSGAIRGSYDADRFFFDISGNYDFDFSSTTTSFSAGLRYVRQNNDAYLESGGAAVPSVSIDALSITGGAKTFFGTGNLRPFAEADVRYGLDNDFGLPAGVVLVNDARFLGRAGIGINYASSGVIFEAGAGVNLTESGYDGFDATVRALFRF